MCVKVVLDSHVSHCRAVSLQDCKTGAPPAVVYDSLMGCDADGEGSAAIACVVMTAFDVLRAMDVSECQVVVPFSHSAEGNILYSANTLIVPATVAAFNREMGHEDDGKLCRI